MKKQPMLALVLVLLLAISLAPMIVVGQEADPACFGLPAEDCAVIAAASENSQANIESFNQEFTLSVNGSGFEVLAAFGGFLPLPFTIPTAFSLDVAGSGPFTFADPDATTAAEFSLPVQVVVFDGTETVTLNVPFVVADGYLYTDATGELVGVPLNDETAAELGDVLPLPLPLDVLLDPNVTNIAGLLGEDFDTEAMLNPSGTDFSAAITYERLPDEDLNGATVSPFAFTLDLGTLLALPEAGEFVGVLGGLLAGGMGDGDDMDGEGGGMGDFGTDFLLGFLPSLLSGLGGEVVITQYVGVDDNFVHSISFSTVLTLDFGVLLAPPAPEGDAPTAPTPVPMDIPMIEITVDFVVELTDINGEVSVSAPEGARLLTVEEAIELFGVEDMAMPEAPAP